MSTVNESDNKMKQTVTSQWFAMISHFGSVYNINNSTKSLLFAVLALAE